MHITQTTIHLSHSIDNISFENQKLTYDEDDQSERQLSIIATQVLTQRINLNFRNDNDNHLIGICHTINLHFHYLKRKNSYMKEYKTVCRTQETLY